MLFSSKIFPITNTFNLSLVSHVLAYWSSKFGKISIAYADHCQARGPGGISGHSTAFTNCILEKLTNCYIQIPSYKYWILQIAIYKFLLVNWFLHIASYILPIALHKLHFINCILQITSRKMLFKNLTNWIFPIGSYKFHLKNCL